MILQVQDNSAVWVHFELFLDDGTQTGSSRAQGKPALFRLGDGSLSPALEQRLLGHQVGDKINFVLNSAEAFGEKQANLIQFFFLSDFSVAGIPEIGSIVLFSAQGGQEMPGVIREIIGESVSVDFNHPLAGYPITFKIEILRIEQVQRGDDENSVG